MGTKVGVDGGTEAVKCALQAALASQEGLEEGDLDPWAVSIDAPYAAYLEFGTGPTTKTGSRHRQTDTEAKRRFKAWAAAKGFGVAFGERIYHRIMERGLDPHPYLRPAMYSVIDDLERGEWDGPYTPRAVADEIAERVRLIVLNNNLIGAGDPETGVHLLDTISSDRADRTPNVPLHPSVSEEGLWTRAGQRTGVMGKVGEEATRDR